MAQAHSQTVSAHGGTTGQGAGTKRPSGTGSWRSSAPSSRTQPWRTTLPSRRRVARRVRGRSGHPPVTSSQVLTGMVASAAPPTLSRHHVATAPASHRRAARSGSRRRVGPEGGLPVHQAAGQPPPGLPADRGRQGLSLFPRASTCRAPACGSRPGPCHANSSPVGAQSSSRAASRWPRPADSCPPW